ncbi:toll/interleukin-1 receptor domain-containing protein [Streptantibioticus parmotrematis]|uniref:toll/interleukin-1 receptor domain-containing protein n=1 Tax=Streptantibioticus parmotrematis TaxID=2873249 RepID=UPI0033E4E7BE
MNVADAPVFINYRTADELGTATAIEGALTERFGAGCAFRDSSSILAGDDYRRSLLEGVRRCRVLLAVIGSRWLEVPDRDDPRRRAVDNPQDWTRREIITALNDGVRVIPVLVHPRHDPLLPAELPRELHGLADCQFRLLDHRTHRRDLAQLADELAELVPSLAQADRLAAHSEETTSVRNSVGEVSGTVLQTGSFVQHDGTNTFARDIGTVVHGDQAQVNSGSGDQYNARFTGDGVNYVVGGNKGGIRQRFGDRRERRDDER